MSDETDASKVVIFGGHQVVKGPKSFTTALGDDERPLRETIEASEFESSNITVDKNPNVGLLDWLRSLWPGDNGGSE